MHAIRMEIWALRPSDVGGTAAVGVGRALRPSESEGLHVHGTSHSAVDVHLRTKQLSESEIEVIHRTPVNCT